MKNRISKQPSPLPVIEELAAASVISGYWGAAPKLGYGEWDGQTVWEIEMIFENTPQHSGRYSVLEAPAPPGFEGKLGVLRRVRLEVEGVRVPISVRLERVRRRKWKFVCPDVNLEHQINDPRSPSARFLRGLTLERSASRGEVTVEKAVEDPLKVWVVEGAETDAPITNVQVTCFKDLEHAYLLAQQISMILKAAY